jgi:hypothetical protein
MLSEEMFAAASDYLNSCRRQLDRVEPIHSLQIDIGDIVLA